MAHHVSFSNCGASLVLVNRGFISSSDNRGKGAAAAQLPKKERSKGHFYLKEAKLQFRVINVSLLKSAVHLMAEQHLVIMKWRQGQRSYDEPIMLRSRKSC